MALHAAFRARHRARKSGVGDFRAATGGSAVPAIPLDVRSVGMSQSRGTIAHLRAAGKALIEADYCFASGRFSTPRQAGGNCAMVIGGFGFGGTLGGLGCSTESLNQKARSPALQPSSVPGSGWLSHSPEPGGHLMRMWK